MIKKVHNSKVLYVLICCVVCLSFTASFAYAKEEGGLVSFFKQLFNPAKDAVEDTASCTAGVASKSAEITVNASTEVVRKTGETAQDVVEAPAAITQQTVDGTVRLATDPVNTTGQMASDVVNAPANIVSDVAELPGKVIN